MKIMVRFVLVLRHARAARQIILHRKSEHNRQPEKPGNRRQPNQARAVFNVHKIPHDERHFCKSDEQRDERVRARKNVIQINERGSDRQNCSDHQNPENH